MRLLIGAFGLSITLSAGCATQSGSDPVATDRQVELEDGTTVTARTVPEGTTIEDCVDPSGEYMGEAWCPADADRDGAYTVNASDPFNGDVTCLCLVAGDPGSSWEMVATTGGLGPFDCNGTNAAVYTGATETCDGVDNDCDTSVDESGSATTWYADSDSDTYGNPAEMSMACSAPSGYVADNTDCNDSNSAVNPAATEVCNGLDDDCNDGIDEGVTSVFYADTDVDGFGDPASSITSCSAPSGYTADWTDCDDDAMTGGDINPGAVEDCDGIDNDCSFVVDDNLTAESWGAVQSYSDSDMDGYGAGSALGLVCDLAEGLSANNTDCNDANDGVNPAATETCNGIDDDCNDGVDEAGVCDPLDSDGDGDPDTTDCNVTNPAINHSASESCNGVDDDCDASVDEGVTSTFYADTDGDGYGDMSVSASACSASAGWVANATDCDDSMASVNPGETEVPFNGEDDDCDEMAATTATATIVVTPNATQMTVPWELWVRDGTVDPYGTTTSTWASGGAVSGTGALTATVTLTDGNVEMINGPFNGGTYWGFMIGTENLETTITVNGYEFTVANTCWDGTYTCTTGGTDAWWTVDTL